MSLADELLADLEDDNDSDLEEDISKLKLWLFVKFKIF